MVNLTLLAALHKHMAPFLEDPLLLSCMFITPLQFLCAIVNEVGQVAVESTKKVHLLEHDTLPAIVSDIFCYIKIHFHTEADGTHGSDAILLHFST